MHGRHRSPQSSEQPEFVFFLVFIERWAERMPTDAADATDADECSAAPLH
jgi:hypothetical protein